MTKAELVLLGAFATSILALNGKIVWDWLKRRKDPDPEKEVHCPDHKNCMARLARCEKCLSLIKGDHKTLKALFVERTGAIINELRRGSRKFEGINGTMGQIQQDISAVMAILDQRKEDLGSVNERRKTGG